MMFTLFILTPILGFALIYPFRQWWRELTQIAGFIAQSAALLSGVGLYVLVCRLMVRIEHDVS